LLRSAAFDGRAAQQMDMAANSQGQGRGSMFAKRRSARSDRRRRPWTLTRAPGPGGAAVAVGRIRPTLAVQPEILFYRKLS
jgi:hypothetical protein